MRTVRPLRLRAGRSGPHGHASRRIGARLDRALASEHGAILLMVALGMVVILGMTGLALDLGRGYLERARLSRAVDAGVLAGARSLRMGQEAARRQALAVAEANGVGPGGRTELLDVHFGRNDHGESTVGMTARRRLPTTFMRVLGRTEMDVASSAVAAVPPVDMVLVLDQSGSLDRMDAWDDLQAAAKQFVRHFDDAMDQMGLVSFQVRATHRRWMDHHFTNEVEAAIDAMRSAGDTNTGEGLRFALEQFQSNRLGERSVKVVVFFTDGRPTAFRGVLGPAGPPDGGSALGPFESSGPGAGSLPADDRIMAVFVVQRNCSGVGCVRGYFDDPESLGTDRIANPDGCASVTNCWGRWTEPTVRDKARRAGLEVANAVREEGVHLYTIGLGDPTADDPLLVPDLDYLRELANEDGVTDPDQPRGKSYFAPSATELRAVFDQVAQDLLVRLAQ